MSLGKLTKIAYISLNLYTARHTHEPKTDTI